MPPANDNLLARLKGRVGTTTNNRLVKRWTTDGQLQLPLHVETSKSADGLTVTAVLANVSITGFMVHVPGECDVKAGATVTLGRDDMTAVCEVVHAGPVPFEERRQIGLHIVEMSDEFRRVLFAAVASLRKDQSTTVEPWSDQD